MSKTEAAEGLKSAWKELGLWMSAEIRSVGQELVEAERMWFSERYDPKTAEYYKGKVVWLREKEGRLMEERRQIMMAVISKASSSSADEIKSLIRALSKHSVSSSMESMKVTGGVSMGDRTEKERMMMMWP